MTTISDIAKLSGVSPATVSKVINRRSGVGEATTQRIWETIDQADFHPRSLAARRRRALLILPNNPGAMQRSRYLRTAHAGLVEGALQAGLSLSTCGANYGSLSGASLRQMVRADGSRGAILLATRNDYALVDQLAIERIPHVVVGSSRHTQNVCQVVLDDEASSRAATQYLLDLGHRQIQIVTCSRRDMGHDVRFSGYAQAMQGAGLEVHQGVELNGVTLASGAAAFEQIRSGGQHPTAVIVTNEVLAIGLLRAARAAGISVPEKLSVLAYESSGDLALADPSITAMVSPVFEMGREAIRLFISQIDRGEASSSQNPTVAESTTVCLAHSLMVRQTTAEQVLDGRGREASSW